MSALASLFVLHFTLTAKLPEFAVERVAIEASASLNRSSELTVAPRDAGVFEVARRIALVGQCSFCRVFCTHTRCSFHLRSHGERRYGRWSLA